MNNASENHACKKRALGKILISVLVAGVLIALLSHFISDQALDELKHSLSLWTIIALVVIINLAGFICFLVLFAVYQWIRCDLKPQKHDVLKDKS